MVGCRYGGRRKQSQIQKRYPDTAPKAILKKLIGKDVHADDVDKVECE